jgi:hypothetical protein
MYAMRKRFAQLLGEMKISRDAARSDLSLPPSAMRAAADARATLLDLTLLIPCWLCACQYCVNNGLKFLVYTYVHSGFSPIFALSRLRSLRFSTPC